ncbi:response regulator transcription factor [Christensenella intestinihominis]|uniref:response regulator transcription factor n=1 Tax=Christensenella intestinihominis TaxID=1851429 RepID=UPI00082DA919|nr:response regulator transcription factor [Christensenella intestinihominis]
MKLLIIEDEEDLREALCAGLTKKGYITDSAADGNEGFELAFVNDYDLILLDLNLPGMDGLTLLQKIREHDLQQKVLILSARSDYGQRIEGLDLGANDYLVKPFDFGELEARIRSLLRRSFTQHNTVIRFDRFRLDTCAHLVYTEDNQAVSLTPKEYAILEYLLLNRGKVISPEELIEHVWGSDDSLFSNAIKVHMSALRKKLAEFSANEIIINMRGAGYCIKNPVQNIASKLGRNQL